MQNIAVLLTCFNRKNKTLESLGELYKAYSLVHANINISIYLTDDGSTDGTGEAVKSKYPQINVLQGTGDLFWAGGMRNSWNEALKGNYDGYLLLNDDTNVYENLFVELLETHDYSLSQFNEGGIYIGSTINYKTNLLSYGGANFTNRFMAYYTKVKPNGTPQECELGNANIMLVSKNVVNKIGILSKAYIHGLADFDYTLMAKKNKLPVMITPNFLGECLNENSNPYDKFSNLSLRDRIKVLYNPIGLDFKSNIQYMKRNFPYRLPFVFIMGWLKVLFPKIYSYR